jgi:hypothetical protein
MNHRITHAMVGVVAGALIIAALAFSLVVIAANGRAATETAIGRAPVIPLISHPVNESMSDCTRCHVASEGALPASHTTHGASTCLTCHAEASRSALVGPKQPATPAIAPGPKPIPHPVGEPYTDCVACHAIGGNRGMPENHVDFTNGQCSSCHAGPSSLKEGGGPAGAGVGPLVPHEVGGQFVNCDTCHAFGMGDLSMPANHEGFTRQTCTNCHRAAH